MNVKNLESKNIRYCVFDFDEFWEACEPTDAKDYRPWEEIRVMKTIFIKMFGKSRIEPGMQKMILDEVRLRVKKGVQWMRSGNSTNLPIVMLNGDDIATVPPPGAILKLVQRKMSNPNRIVTDICKADDVGLKFNGVYVSSDGIPIQGTVSYYYDSERTLLSELNRILKIRHFVIENWSNVMISRGKKGFNDSAKYQVFYNMFSPILNTPTLFGNTKAEDFFNSLSSNKISEIKLIDSEFSYATLRFDLPESICGMSLIGLSQYFTVVVLVNRKFMQGIQSGLPISDLYFDIVSTVGTMLNRPGVNETAARVILCFALIVKAVPVLVHCTPSLPHALMVLYHKVCSDMYDNRRKAIWIAAGKGSGKSKILTAIREKGFVVIDSDAYGRVLYQMLLNREKGGGCPYDKTSDPLIFAKWIYDFISSPDFEDSPSFHEIYAQEFCKQKDITVNKLIANTVPSDTYRTFSFKLTMACKDFIKVQDFCNLIGYIPALVSGDDTENVPTMVIFGHNTLELFPAMTSALFKMETIFDSLAAVLSRDRMSDQVSQLFLAVFYMRMEPLIANAVPAYIIKQALDSLPSYL